MALLFLRQPVFPLAIYVHAMTFVFTGMFVASSSGEMLFNKEEADILLHRPVTPRQLLWAKVGVLVRISLWLSFAFNAVGLVVGIYAPGGTVWYPVVHAVSLSCEAIFCTALVIVVYQLCLRWFGREWLDQMMTTAQVVVAIGAVVAGQVVPRMIRFVGRDALFQVDAWWISLIPPAWFAGFDDALAGSHAVRSWWLAGGALAATGFVVWLSFGVLARDFGAGLQKLGESRSIQPRSAGQGRLLRTMVGVPPFKWWLREPVSRASFLLTAAYLVRDRDVKLRVYPSLAPILIMPFAMMLSGSRRQWDADDHVIGLGLAGAFLAIMPAMGLNLLRFSQQWQAADVFRVAPMPGPAPLCHGARKAAILFLGLPLFVAIGIIVWLFMHQLAPLALLLPGLIALPLFSLIPCLRGQAVPLSISSEEAKSASETGGKSYAQ